MKKAKVHYAPYGEWGGEKVTCARYYSANVAISGNPLKVTCEYCLKQINKK